MNIRKESGWCSGARPSIRPSTAYLAKLKSGISAPEGDPQPYLMLSAAFLRLNELDQAVAAVSEALRLYTRSESGYLQAANVFMRKNLSEDAANALAEGLMLTSGAGLAQAFATLYRGGPDASQCDVIQTPTGEAIDPHCAPFRRRVCAIYPDVLKVRMETGRSDLVEQERVEFEQKYGCPRSFRFAADVRAKRAGAASICVPPVSGRPCFRLV